MNKKVATAAFKNAAGHLSCLGEELVALAFFHKNVSCDEQCKMIQALQSAGSKDIPKRVLNVEDTFKKKNLHDFVTSTTTRVFSILPGITLLGCSADPETWHQYDGYVSVG